MLNPFGRGPRLPSDPARRTKRGTSGVTSIVPAFVANPGRVWPLRGPCFSIALQENQSKLPRAVVALVRTGEELQF